MSAAAASIQFDVPKVKRTSAVKKAEMPVSKVKRSDLAFIRVQLERCKADPENCYDEAEAAWSTLRTVMDANSPHGWDLISLSSAISDIQLAHGAWETEPDYMEGRSDLDKAIHTAFEALELVEKTVRILKK